MMLIINNTYWKRIEEYFRFQMNKLKDWLSDFFDLSYRQFEEQNLIELMGVNARTYSIQDSRISRRTNNPTFADKMSRIIYMIQHHVHSDPYYYDESYKWEKSYSNLWWKFDKAQRKVSSVYNIYSEDFNAEKYYNALRKYVKEHERELDKQSFAERLMAVFSATIRAYF